MSIVSSSLPTGLTYSPTPVAYHGADECDREPNPYGRRVVQVPGHTWPARPEECAETRAEWASDHPDAPLLCCGCGLDVS